MLHENRLTYILASRSIFVLKDVLDPKKLLTEVPVPPGHFVALVFRPGVLRYLGAIHSLALFPSLLQLPPSPGLLDLLVEKWRRPIIWF